MQYKHQESVFDTVRFWPELLEHRVVANTRFDTFVLELFLKSQKRLT